jgi:hypothetical protein
MDYTNLFGVFYQFCSVFSTRFIRCFSGNLFGVFDIGWGRHQLLDEAGIEHDERYVFEVD